jgi:LmbE family N-acetylglucosaminyl deacetylase
VERARWRFVPPAKALIRTAAVLVLLLRGRPSRALTSSRSIVVLAPHPDDETLGCGVVVARQRARGGAVTIVIVTDGAGNPPGRPPEQVILMRRDEAVAAATELGLPEQDIWFLGFPDQQLDRFHADLVDRLASLVEELAPEDVLVTHPDDPHADHAALGRAAVEALANSPVRMWTYPIWQWQDPRCLLRLVGLECEYVSTRSHRSAKRHAIRAFRSQLGSIEDGGLPAGLLRACDGR